MKIAGYIGDLLYEYECVVIPGLGGFLTRDHNASVHPVRHYLKPPYREVVFNPLLRTNDGLLLSHIARSEKLSYQEAKGKLDRFVLKCISMMEEGKRIHFRQIGSIYFNKDSEIVFQADDSMNYLPESFGLSGIVSPPIKREDFQQKIETVFNKPLKHQKAEAIPQRKETKPETIKREHKEKPKMVASYRKSNFRRQLSILVAAVVIMLFGIGYMNKHIVQQYYRDYAAYTSVLPIFYASPNEFLIKNRERVPLEHLILFDEKVVDSKLNTKPAINDLKPEEVYKAELSIYPQLKPESVNEPSEVVASKELEVTSQDVAADQNESETIQLIDSVAINQPALVDQMIVSNRFFIIAGAFRERANAEKLISELRTKGYQADYAGQTKSGLWRVSFEAFSDETVALQRLQLVKREENANAWLLKI